MVRRYGARWGAVDLASRTGFVMLLFALPLRLYHPAVSSAFSAI